METRTARERLGGEPTLHAIDSALVLELTDGIDLDGKSGVLVYPGLNWITVCADGQYWTIDGNADVLTSKLEDAETFLAHGR